MPNDEQDRDAEHLDLVIEALELRIEELQTRLQAQRELRDLGDRDHAGTDEIVERLNADYQASMAELRRRFDAHNAKVLEHMGFAPADSDIPPVVQDFLDTMFPGATVIRVGSGSLPFGDFDLTDFVDPPVAHD